MKNFAFGTVLMVILTALTTSSCNKIPEESTPEKLPKEPVPIDLNLSQIALVESGNAFAFDIFRLILDSADASENVIISPFSISYALSMVLNGANGATRDSMLKTLRVKGITPEEINSSCKDLTRALLSVDKRVIMSIANSVWTEKNFNVKKPFMDVLTAYYDTEHKQFDITDIEGTCYNVNRWIEDKTMGLIKNMLSRDDLDPLTVMLLINAIYFKGQWKTGFDPENTSEKLFCEPSGNQIGVPMMKCGDTIGVYFGDGFKMAEFPYGQGNFVMDIILPDTQTGTGDLLPSVTNASFNGWISQLDKKSLNVSLPRFKYGFHKHLKDILEDMGMGIAFTWNADFKNIVDQPVYIKDVIHQAFIETREEGTEAAAATIVIFEGQCAGSTVLAPEFNADHSFLYIIREIKTNVIIFMGRVANPLAE